MATKIGTAMIPQAPCSRYVMTEIKQNRASQAVFLDQAAWALTRGFFHTAGGALQTVMFACYSGVAGVTGAGPVCLGFPQETA